MITPYRIHSLSFALAAFLTLAASADCVGSLPLDDRPCPCAAGWTCCPSKSVCVSDGSQCPGSSSSTRDDSGAAADARRVPGDAAAACPTVALLAPQSVQDIVSAVQGRWMVCEYLSSLFPTWAPGDTVGMEFTPATAGGGSCGSSSGCMGGLVYFLVQGSSGLTRGNGNGYQIWYSIDTTLELTLAQTPTNGTWSTSVSLSSNPREFWIEQLSYMDGPRLVAAQ